MRVDQQNATKIPPERQALFKLRNGLFATAIVSPAKHMVIFSYGVTSKMTPQPAAHSDPVLPAPQAVPKMLPFVSSTRPP
jgi:hypothetical protein